MMSLETAVARPPLVLLVDPVVSSRHWTWRALSRAFGVLEAGTADGARDWIARRPEIDALVIENELPDRSGAELVRDLANASLPIASHSIVLARPNADWTRLAVAGATLVEHGDLRAVVAKLVSWFLPRDAPLAKAVLREAERRRA